MQCKWCFPLFCKGRRFAAALSVTSSGGAALSVTSSGGAALSVTSSGGAALSVTSSGGAALSAAALLVTAIFTLWFLLLGFQMSVKRTADWSYVLAFKEAKVTT